MSLDPGTDGAPAATRPAAPLADAYWLVPGLLLAGAHPAMEPTATAARLEALLDLGTGLVVDLTEPGEVDHGDAYARLEALARVPGLAVRVARIPIADGATPSGEAVRAALDVIDASLAESVPVYLHCRAGLGRTGTIAGCWLRENGVPRDAVAGRLAALRARCATGGSPSPETDGQRERVATWGDGAAG